MSLVPEGGTPDGNREAIIPSIKEQKRYLHVGLEEKGEESS